MTAKVRYREERGIWEVIAHYQGKRVRQRCESEAEAIALADDINARIKAGGVATSKVFQKRRKEILRFGAYADKWVSEMRKSKRKETTVDRYDSCLRIHLKPEFENDAIEYLDYARIKVFCLQKAASLSRDSVRLIIATLRLILKEAMREGIIQNNPASGLGEFYGEATDDEVDPFTRNELGRILAHSKKSGFFEFVLTLARTGMRFGEARALRWQDVDFRKKRIRVVRNWPAHGGITVPKTQRSRREIDMSPQLAAALKALRARRKAEYLSRGKSEIPELVFLSPGAIRKEGRRLEGQPINYTNFRSRCWDKVLAAAKVRYRGIHHLRHTYATQLLAPEDGSNPANVFYVSRQLGHAKNTMTLDTYTHWIQESSTREADRLDAEIPEVEEGK